jgi:hypothetical protein
MASDLAGLAAGGAGMGASAAGAGMEMLAIGSFNGVRTNGVSQVGQDTV